MMIPVDVFDLNRKHVIDVVLLSGFHYQIDDLFNLSPAIRYEQRVRKKLSQVEIKFKNTNEIKIRG